MTRRLSLAPLQCAGRARNLRRHRPRARPPAAGPARQAGARGRRQPERQCPRRRRRGADRRAAASTAGSKRRERFIRTTWEPPSPSQRKAPEASQVGAPGAGRREAATSRPPMSSSPAPARTTPRTSPSASLVRGSAKRRPKARASRKPKPRRRKLLLVPADNEPMTRNASARLRRRDRGAQRRQIDFGQRTGRPEGRDRQREGADHAFAADGHRDSRTDADSAGRYAGNFRAAAAARPGDGRCGLDRRAGCRPHPAGHRFRGGRDAGSRKIIASLRDRRSPCLSRSTKSTW